MHIRGLTTLSVIAALLALHPSASHSQQQQIKAADWPNYNRDLGATRYSPLNQINTRNVARMKAVWSYKIGGPSANGMGFDSEMTPIVVDGVLYVGGRNFIAALEAHTGKEQWRYEVVNGDPSKRGVSYWPGDANIPARVFVTAGKRLIALGARTGEPVGAFGKGGEVDMVVPYTSAPTIYKNLLLVGTNGNPGGTRAFDAKTGEKVWEFHSVPQAGEPGNETWENESWKTAAGGNQWSFSMTVDAPRETVFATYDSPGQNDYYGGTRNGNNLYSNSVVALDVNTGKLKWYYQVSHHDLWDYDFPSPPVMMDLTINNQRTPILAITNKNGFMFILNRDTGKPVFGAVETPVAVSDVPGEKSSPTQPIPVKPPALARNTYKPEDIVTAADTNEEHAKFCRELTERSGGFYNAGPFTPYVYRAPGAPPRSTILFPGSIGGVNWGGMAADPGLGYIFVNTMDEASIGWIEQRQGRGGVMTFARGSAVGATSRFQWKDAPQDSGGNIFPSGEGAWPCQKPPWGQLIAVNAKTGEFAWKIPFGVTDQLPAGKQNTGRLNMGGPIATAGGLVFIGATNDRRFRAFDSRTGKELWVTKLAMSAHAVPITFQGKNGKQYVAVVAAGSRADLDDPGPANEEALTVFALP
jgi:glucose dehydrogenase